MDVCDIATPRLINLRDQVQHDLYLDFVHDCARHKVNTDMAAGAAMHLLITLIHRMNQQQGDAEAKWDELYGQGKALLAERFHKKLNAAGHEYKIPA